MSETVSNYISDFIVKGIEQYKDNLDEFIEFARAMKSNDEKSGHQLQLTTFDLLNTAVQEKRFDDATKLKNVYEVFPKNDQFNKNDDIIKQFNALNTEITLAEHAKNEVTKQDVLRMLIKVENCPSDDNVDGFLPLCSKLDEMLEKYIPEEDNKFNIPLIALKAQYKTTQTQYNDEFHAFAPAIFEKLKNKAEEKFYTEPVEAFDILGKIIYYTDENNKELSLQAARLVCDFAHKTLPNEITSSETLDGETNIFSNKKTTVDTLLGCAIEKTAGNPEIESSVRAFMQKRFLIREERIGFEKAFDQQESFDFAFKGIIEPLNKRTDNFVNKLHEGNLNSQNIFLTMIKVAVNQFAEKTNRSDFNPVKSSWQISGGFKPTTL